MRSILVGRVSCKAFGSLESLERLVVRIFTIDVLFVFLFAIRLLISGPLVLSAGEVVVLEGSAFDGSYVSMVVREVIEVSDFLSEGLRIFMGLSKSSKTAESFDWTHSSVYHTLSAMENVVLKVFTLVPLVRDVMTTHEVSARDTLKTVLLVPRSDNSDRDVGVLREAVGVLDVVTPELVVMGSVMLFIVDTLMRIELFFIIVLKSLFYAVVEVLLNVFHEVMLCKTAFEVFGFIPRRSGSLRRSRSSTSSGFLLSFLHLVLESVKSGSALDVRIFSLIILEFVLSEVTFEEDFIVRVPERHDTLVSLAIHKFVSGSEVLTNPEALHKGLFRFDVV